MEKKHLKKSVKASLATISLACALIAGSISDITLVSVSISLLALTIASVNVYLLGVFK